jgi:hypothetical protein
MKLKSVIILTLLFTSRMIGQTSIANSDSDIVIDIDNDGIVDTTRLVESIDSDDSSYKIVCTLSSWNNKKISSGNITNGGLQNGTITAEKNIPILSIQLNRSHYTLKFRYDKKLKNIMLIGFDDEQYGGATNDGSGKSSYNLSTGLYEASWYHFDEKQNKLIPFPKISKKLPLKNYLLQNFNDKTIEALENINYKLFPQSLK